MISSEPAQFLADSTGRTTGYSVAKDLLKVMPRDTKSPTIYLDSQIRSNKIAKKCEREGFGRAFDAGVREALKEHKDADYKTPIFNRFWQAKEIIAQSDLSQEDKAIGMAQLDEEEAKQLTL